MDRVLSESHGTIWNIPWKLLVTLDSLLRSRLPMKTTLPALSVILSFVLSLLLHEDQCFNARFFGIAGLDMLQLRRYTSRREGVEKGG